MNVESYLISLLEEPLPIVIGELPSLKTEGIAMNTYGSIANAEYFACEDASSTIFKPLIRCIIRAKTYEQAELWHTALKKTWHNFQDEYLLAVRQIGSPIYLGRNPERMYEFLVQFKIQIRSD